MKQSKCLLSIIVISLLGLVASPLVMRGAEHGNEETTPEALVQATIETLNEQVEVADRLIKKERHAMKSFGQSLQRMSAHWSCSPLKRRFARLCRVVKHSRNDLIKIYQGMNQKANATMAELLARLTKASGQIQELRELCDAGNAGGADFSNKVLECLNEIKGGLDNAADKADMTALTTTVNNMNTTIGSALTGAKEEILSAIEAHAMADNGGGNGDGGTDIGGE